MTATPNPNANIYGTCLQGYINVPYARIVELIGEPHSDGDGYKVDAEWCFDTPAGTATLYNWKNGPNYGGPRQVRDIDEWHIGGAHHDVVRHVRALLA